MMNKINLSQTRRVKAHRGVERLTQDRIVYFGILPERSWYSNTRDLLTSTFHSSEGVITRRRIYVRRFLCLK